MSAAQQEPVNRGPAAAGGPTFREVYDRFAGDILAFLSSRLPYGVLAEDVAQDVWIKVHGRLSTFDGQNIRAWLYEVARNAAIDAIRRKKRRRESDGELQEADVAASAPIEEDLRLEALRNCLKQVGGKFVSILISNKLDGHTVEELAAREKVQPATIYTRINRAKQELTDCVNRRLT